jgi:hypothetical protein
MARMPFNETMGGWAPGHYLRKVPEGYERAAIDEGTIVDPNIQAYWEKLKILTRGPIFDPRRLRLIVRFNLGLEPAPKPSVELALAGPQGAKVATAAE